MPVAIGIAPILGGRLRALAVLVLGLVGDRIDTAQPAGEVDVGAAARAERAVLVLGWPAADRAFAASGGRWLGLRHHARPLASRGDLVTPGLPRPGAAS